MPPQVLWVIDPVAEDFLAIKKTIMENSEVHLSEVTQNTHFLEHQEWQSY